MPRYTLCPYYKDENKKSISCEDAIRRFDALNTKWSWMDKYCDDKWQDCPYAVAITKAYEMYEEGDESALENEKIKALQKELKGALSKQGRAEKKIKKQAEEIKALKHNNEVLMDIRRKEYKKRKALEDELFKRNDAVIEQLNHLTGVYESRMAYLMCTLSDGTFKESDAQAWGDSLEDRFTITFDKTDGDTVWKVVFSKDAENKNQQNEKQVRQ